MKDFILTIALFLSFLVMYGCSGDPDAQRATENERQEGATTSTETTQPMSPPQPTDTDAVSTPASGKNGASEGELSRDDPEAVLRAFLVAMTLGDREAGTRLMMPNPDADILWTGERPPPEHLRSAMAFLQSVVFQRLQVGDTVNLPNGITIVFDEGHVNEDRQQITLPKNPVPFTMVRDQGGWRVDAGGVIAARKAVAALEKGGLATPETERDPDAVDLPTWSPGPDDIERLSPPVELSGFTIRPPRGFKLVKDDLASSGLIFWRGPIRDDETYAYFMVIITTLSEEDSKLPLETILDDVVAGVRQRRREWTRTATERGNVNGLTFVRTRWSGVATSAARKGLAGRQMHGFVYLTVDDTNAVQILCHDVEPGHAKALKAGEAAALTIRKTGK
ncbi:MAG: hypothetical protein HQ567_18140 [Candidatus Nealsonbacteria bacterium]|nr:hypothetical protein [Candidatus Nealsonbacteria bacterium]